MLVCHCHKVSSHQIRACAREGGGIARVCKRLGAGTACGGCMPLVSELVEAERGGSGSGALRILSAAVSTAGLLP